MHPTCTPSHKASEGRLHNMEAVIVKQCKGPVSRWYRASWLLSSELGTLLTLGREQSLSRAKNNHRTLTLFVNVFTTEPGSFTFEQTSLWTYGSSVQGLCLRIYRFSCTPSIKMFLDPPNLQAFLVEIDAGDCT